MFLTLAQGSLIAQINIEDEQFCGPSTVTFTSSDVGCASYEWYSEIGVQLTTGCTFTTPEIAFTQTYEVRSAESGVSNVTVQAIDNCASNTCGDIGPPIVNIDFGTGTDNGPALATGITDYTFNNGVLNPAVQQGLAQYSIVSTTTGLNNGWWGNAQNPGQPILDHTPGDVNGKMLVINADSDPKEFYRLPVNDLCSSSYYVFSASFINVLDNSNTPCSPNEIPFNVSFRIEDGAGNVLGSKSTGDVFGSATLPTWTDIDFRVYIPSAGTDVELVLVNNIGGACGNDLAIDDIQFRACQPALNLFTEAKCTDTVSAITAEFGPEIPFPDFQWQQSTDNGSTWFDLTGETNDTLAIAFDDVNTLDQYRLVAAKQGEINNVSCLTFSDPISLPEPLGELSIDFDPINSICEGESAINITYSGMAVGSDSYGIDWDNDANFAGIVDVPDGTALSGGNITISDLGDLDAGTYSGLLVFESGTTTCNDTIPLSFEVNEVTGGSQFSCSEFQSIVPSDFGFVNSSTGNSGSEDLSAKFGLPTGSVIVTVSNISTSNSNTFMNENGGASNKSIFTFSGNTPVKTKAIHRPIQVHNLSGGRDGIISEDMTPYLFKGDLAPIFTAGSENNNYFVSLNSQTTGNAGSQIWESIDFTSGLSFYTVGQVSTNVHELELCAQVEVEVCGSLALPDFSGSNLSPDLSYFTESGGLGDELAIDDLITADGTYYVYDNGPTSVCSTEESFKVNILDSPILDPIDNVTACDSFLLPVISGTNLTGSLNYYSEPNGNGTEFLPNTYVKTSGTYYVVDSAVGTMDCKSEKDFNVGILSTPEIDELSDTTVCGSFKLPLIQGTNLTAGVAYFTAPDGGGGMFSAGEDITSNTMIYAYDERGTSVVCNSEKSFMITVNPGPVIDNINDVSECDSFLLPLVTGTNLTGSLNYYSEPNGDGTEFLPNTYVKTSGTYYVVDSVVGTMDCKSEKDFNVSVTNTPNITSQPKGLIVCRGEPTFVEVKTSLPSETINWYEVGDLLNRSQSDSSILQVFYEGGFYAVMSNGNCEVTSDTAQVELVELTLSASAEPEEVLFPEETILSAVGFSTEAFNFSWRDPLGNLVFYGSDYLVSPPSSGIYTAIAESSSGCIDSIPVFVKVTSLISAPNVFTPNGDGENDTFVIAGVSEWPDAVVRVFNRWGVLIYETSNYASNEWDAEGVPDGVYYYLMEYEVKGKPASQTGVIHVLSK